MTKYLELPQCRYAAITSDEHLPPTLKRGAWAKKPEVKGDVERSFRAVDFWCQEHKEEGIVRISLGDTLDSSEPEPDRMRWLADYLHDHLQNVSCYVYIQGQHDRVARCPQVPWLSVLAKTLSEENASFNLLHAHDHILSIMGREFLFFDYLPAGQFMPLVYQACQNLKTGGGILCTHQVWQEWIPGSSTATFSDIPAPINMVLAGDYHHQIDNEVRIGRDGQQILVYSLGPLTIQDISEPTQNRFLVFDFQENRLHSIPLPFRPVHQARVTSEDDLNTFLSRIQEKPVVTDDERPLLRLEYDCSIPQIMQHVRSAVHGRYHLFEKPVVLRMPSYASLAPGTPVAGLDRNQCIDSTEMVPKGTPAREIVDLVVDINSQEDLDSVLDKYHAQRLSS